MQQDQDTTERSDSPHARGQRSVQVATRLRELIVAGQLAPGQHISERSTGERLGPLLGEVSRTPLREAFKILEAEGLVRIEPNRGAVVTVMNIDEVASALEVLIGLEAMAAEPACRNITEAELEHITRLHADMAQAHSDRALMPYFDLNQRIHQCIVDAARNSVLSRIYASESARIRRYRYAGNLQLERWTQAVQEHQALLDALRQRAGPLLREMLRQHHQNGWRVAKDMVKNELAPVPTEIPRRRGRPAKERPN